MASRIRGFSAPAAVRGFGDALMEMSKQRDESRRDEFLDARNERRYQIQMARQNRLDSLAAGKIERDEGRYQDEITRRKQSDTDALAGIMAGMNVSVDPKMTGDITKDVITEATTYSDEANKQIVKAYDEGTAGVTRNTEDDLKFEKQYKSYEDINSPNYIEDINRRKVAQLDLADKYGVVGKEKTLGSYPGGIPSMIPYGGAKITEGIARAFSPVVDLFRTPKDIAKANIGMDEFGKMIDRKYKGKSQSDMIDEKLKSIGDIRTKRKVQEKDVDKKVKNLVDTLGIKEKITEKVTTKDVTLSPEDFTNNMYKSRQDAFAKINNDKTLSVKGKIKALEVISGKLLKKQETYDRKRDALIKKQEETRKDKREIKVYKDKKIIDNAAKKEIKRYEILLATENKTPKQIVEFKILKEKLKALRKEND